MRLKPFDNDTLGISGVVPEGWESGQPGEVARRASPVDPTVLFQRGWAEVAIEELKLGVPPLLGLESFPPHVGTRETGLLAWNLYAGERELPETGTIRVDVALAQAGGWSFVVGLVAQGDEAEALHESVFLPAVDALTSPFADPALVNEIERHQAEHNRLVRAARKILRHGNWPDFAAIADQNRSIPVPPPQKPYDEGSEVIELPQPDRSALQQTHIFDLIRDRKSRRTFTAESLTLGELAYLLWATQGVREVFPGNVGSYRTVPSGGCRHPFETYLAINRVDGLAPGVYRYLPFQHQLVFLFPAQDLSHRLEALTTNRRPGLGQAAVFFVWSVVPYRAEWRYGLGARKDILIEAGHVCQNLYLACESIRCGTCAVLGYHQDAIDAFLGLDGEDEMVIYLAPVGKVEP